MVLLLSLQGYLWFSERSLPAVWEAQERVSELNVQNEQLNGRNTHLLHEIEDLKGGRAIEARARLDLGMIKPQESFFIVLEAE